MRNRNVLDPELVFNFSEALWADAGFPKLGLTPQMINQDVFPSGYAVASEKGDLYIAADVTKEGFPAMALVSNILSEMSGYYSYMHNGGTYWEIAEELNKKYKKLFGISVYPVYSKNEIEHWNHALGRKDVSPRLITATMKRVVANNPA